MSTLPIDPDLVLPPGEDDLPCEDGVPMDSPRHRKQMEVLIESIEHHLRDRRDKYVGGNMFLYYEPPQAGRPEFRGPDVFVVLGAEPRQRKSWVVWAEGGRTPDVVIELTSSSTAAEDHGPKKRIYQDAMRVPEYFLYEPLSDTVEGCVLDLRVGRYRPIRPGPSGRLPSARLGLELGIWEGTARDEEGRWLRCFTPDGALVPLASERAEDAERRIRELEAEVQALRAREAGRSDAG